VNRFVHDLATQLAELTGTPVAEVASLLSEPPELEMGDYAYPCFSLAKARRENPARLAGTLAERFRPTDLITRAQAVGPYVNFFVDRPGFAAETLSHIHRSGGGEAGTRQAGTAFGRSEVGAGKTAVIEFSSPNICKPLHVGHLRGTAIGNAIANILELAGYRVVRLNYLGDWGTQFGQVIAAWLLWGEEEALAKNPIHHLVDLYQRFHREVEKKPELVEEARQWFRRLEEGDPEACGHWRRFRELSLRELVALYDRLGVHFDEIWGESDFNEAMAASIDRLKRAGLARESDGALIVDLSADGMPPVLLLKSDGATLYHTREIAAAERRWERFHFAANVYVVGAPQKLHFRQLFRVLELMGYGWARSCVHVEFGHVHGLSTRRGNIIFLRELLDEAKARALQKMQATPPRGSWPLQGDQPAVASNPREPGGSTPGEVEPPQQPDSHEQESVADQVGISALLFNDLAGARAKDASFDWDRVLSFEGGSGVYLQYAHARIAGILRKCGVELTGEVDTALLREPIAHQMVRHVERFPHVVAEAARLYEPSLISQYLLELARLLSASYNELRVKDEERRLAEARLLLLWSVKEVLANGLRLLGLSPLEKM